MFQEKKYSLRFTILKMLANVDGLFHDVLLVTKTIQKQGMFVQQNDCDWIFLQKGFCTFEYSIYTPRIK